MQPKRHQSESKTQQAPVARLSTRLRVTSAANASLNSAAYCLERPTHPVDMARRKRQFLEDEDSDSSVSNADEPDFDDNDPDARAERELFENPYKRKRRRKDAKEDAIYGVFGSDDDVEDPQVERRRTKSRAKAPAFVSSSTKVTMDEDIAMDGGSSSSEEGRDDEDDDDGGASDLSNTGPSETLSSQAREPNDEDDEQPRSGGLGLGASKGGLGFSKAGIGSSGSTPSFTKGGIGSSSTSGFTKGGIGSSASAFTKGGLGFSRATEPAPSAPSTSASASVSASPSPAPVAAEDFPTAFGGARTQRSFLRSSDNASSTPRSATPLSSTERAHFSKISGTFGARMLEKMGWAAGQGLGTTGEGIVTPVESKLRPKGMGLAFKGFQEKTEQSKAEARRRGEIVSDDEEESKAASRKARKAAKAQETRTDAWKKPKKLKTRVEHKTYEEIVAEAGPDSAQAGVGPIIDATGATVCTGIPSGSYGCADTRWLPAQGGVVIGRCLTSVMDTYD